MPEHDAGETARESLETTSYVLWLHRPPNRLYHEITWIARSQFLRHTEELEMYLMAVRGIPIGGSCTISFIPHGCAWVF
jgi:hypothetical protein